MSRSKPSAVSGILVVNKHAGVTSHRIISICRRLFQTTQVGHTGTLDPLATGVLPILIGRAVKASEYVMAGEKRYIATLRLGLTTDTEDVTGTVLTSTDILPPYRDVAAACARFIGPGTQIPPMYSAVKIDGRKLVDLAREGREIARTPREIEIRAIRIAPGTAPESFDHTPAEIPDGFSSREAPDDAVYRDYSLDIVCSKGTYIRTLCADIGKMLGCGGAMATLCRVRSGSYTLDSAYTTDALAAMEPETLLNLPQPAETLFTELPEVTVNGFFAKLIRSGTPLYQKKLRVSLAPGTLVRLKTRLPAAPQSADMPESEMQPSAPQPENAFFALGKAGTDENGDAVIRLEKLFVL